jgi:hypothetical protein
LTPLHPFFPFFEVFPDYPKFPDFWESILSVSVISGSGREPVEGEQDAKAAPLEIK